MICLCLCELQVWQIVRKFACFLCADVLLPEGRLVAEKALSSMFKYCPGRPDQFNSQFNDRSYCRLSDAPA